MKKFAKCFAGGVLAAVVAMGFASCDRIGGAGGVQGVTDSTILVGNTAPTSGAFAMVGVPFNDGIRAYFHRVNQRGGINGRRIEFINHDDGFDPVNGLAFTEALIHDDRVFAIVGHFGTPTIGATLGLLRQTGIPVVYFATGIGALFSDDAFDNARGRSLFPVQAIYVTEGRVLVARAIEEYGARNIGVIFTSDEAGHDYMRGIQYQINRMGPGFRLVPEQVAPGQADVSSAVLRMISEDVDVVIAASLQATFVIIANAIVAGGLNVPVFTSYISADPITLAGFATDYLGSGATFNIYSTAWLDAGAVAEHRDFVDGVTLFGQPALADNAFAQAGWVAGSTFVGGLRNMPAGAELTWDTFIEAMERAPIMVPMAGLMDFSNGRRTGTENLALVRANMATGAWETLRPLEPLQAVLQRIER